MNLKDCFLWFATCPAKALRYNAGFSPIRRFLREGLNLIRYAFDLIVGCLLALSSPIAAPLLYFYLKATAKRRAAQRARRKQQMDDDI